MNKEIRLELNIDIAHTYDAEAVKMIVKTILSRELPRPVKIQSVLVAKP